MHTSHNQPWSSYQPVGDSAAGSYEMDHQIRRKPVSSLKSLNSFTGVSDNSYAGLIDRSQPSDVQRPPPGYQGILRGWLPEILSSCFSIALLIALIVVLRSYHGRGLDDPRLPSWLTLNRLVALIATLNRVALVAPVEAVMSQDVWLWFSPSKQQSQVRSRLEDLEISDNASRGAWGSFVFLWRGGGRWLSHMGAVVMIVSLAFGVFTQQLIGIVSLPVSGSSLGNLSPGNIPHSETWMNSTGDEAEAGLSTTLSMKASIYNGMLEGGIAPLQAFCPTGNCSFPITPTVAVCGEHDHEYHQLVFREAYEGLKFLVVSRQIDVIGTRRLDIAAFDVFGGPYDSFGGSWANSSTISSTCSLWMCVNALAVTTRSNAQTQSIVSTLSETAATLSYTNFESGGTVINFASLPAEMNPRPGANYSVGFLAYMALTEFIMPLANGSVVIYPASHIPSSDTVEAIWNGIVNGLDGWVQNLALSMTNVVRTSAPSTALRYNGTAYQSSIKVRWEWLALPVAMVLTSQFVLVIVIIETSRARVKAWKGSPLAYLMTDVDGAVKQCVGGADFDAYRGVEKAVGRRRVVLDNQLNGRLIFRQAG